MKEAQRIVRQGSNENGGKHGRSALDSAAAEGAGITAAGASAAIVAGADASASAADGASAAVTHFGALQHGSQGTSVIV